MAGDSKSQLWSLFSAQQTGICAAGESRFSVVALSHWPENSLTISVLMVTDD